MSWNFESGKALDEGNEEEIVDLHDSLACIVKQGIPGASEVEKSISVGCK
jgi:hypothetical protein